MGEDGLIEISEYIYTSRGEGRHGGDFGKGWASVGSCSIVWSIDGAWQILRGDSSIDKILGGTGIPGICNLNFSSASYFPLDGPICYLIICIVLYIPLLSFKDTPS